MIEVLNFEQNLELDRFYAWQLFCTSARYSLELLMPPQSPKMLLQTMRSIQLYAREPRFLSGYVCTNRSFSMTNGCLHFPKNSGKVPIERRLGYALGSGGCKVSECLAKSFTCMQCHVIFSFCYSHKSKAWPKTANQQDLFVDGILQL